MKAISPMHRSIDDHNPYKQLNIITKDYSKNFTTRWLLTIGHMALFVVKSIDNQIYHQRYGSINSPSDSPESVRGQQLGVVHDL